MKVYFCFVLPIVQQRDPCKVRCHMQVKDALTLENSFEKNNLRNHSCIHFQTISNI